MLNVNYNYCIIIQPIVKRPWTGAEESNLETIAEKRIRIDEQSDEPNVSSESDNDQVSLFWYNVGHNIHSYFCNARCVQCAFVQCFGLAELFCHNIYIFR